MKVKIYLNINRDPELVAIRFNPTLNFGNLAKEVLRSHVRKQNFKFLMPKCSEYKMTSLVVVITLDEIKDADVITYLNQILVPKSAFIRNIMLRALEGDIRYIYCDKKYKNAVDGYLMKKQKHKEKTEHRTSDFQDRLNMIFS